MRIDYDFNGVNVEGTVFTETENGFHVRNEIHADRKRIYSFPNRIFYEYAYSLHNLMKMGFCYYEFEHRMSEANTFFGSYIDVQNRFRREIVAVKLSEDDYSKASDLEILKSTIEEKREVLEQLCMTRAAAIHDQHLK